MCCTRTERDARKAALLSMAFSIPHAFLLLGPCFVARVLFADQIGSPTDTAAAEGVYGRMASLLLPPGLVGLVVAAMLSATMSTLSASWSVRSASFVNDLYLRFFRPRASDREQIRAGRIAVFAQGAIAVSIAVLVAQTSVGLFALAQSLVALLVIPVITPLLLALFVPRTKRWTALAAMLASVSVAAVNKCAPGLLGREAPLPFILEVPLTVLVATGVFAVSAVLRRTAAEEAQNRLFHERLLRPRLAEAGGAGEPPPLGLMGNFMWLVGGLVLLLAVLPQSDLHRAITVGSAVLLLTGGQSLRVAYRRLKLAAPAPTFA